VLAGALFAYIGQTYTPHKLDDWYYWLMPLALICLTICFLCGWRRLQLANKATETNRKTHFAAEERCADLFGNWRNFFLIAGFILILASKILQPYFGK
jgi:hypothetical protein